MKAFIANLKHLYQCRSMWAIYAIGGLIGWFATSLSQHSTPVQGLRVFPLLLSIFGGLIVGCLIVPILNKPFAFCLPGHPQQVRRMVASLALPVCLTAWGLQLSMPTPADWSWSGAAVLLFLYLCCYWTTASSIIPIEHSLPWFRCLLGLTIAIFFTDVRVAAERLILGYPNVLFLAFSAWVTLAYRDLRDQRVIRRWSGRRSDLSPFANWVAERFLLRRRVSASQGRADAFFVRRIVKARQRERSPHIWGYLYHALGHGLHPFKTPLSVLTKLLLYVVLVQLFSRHGSPDLYMTLFVVFSVSQRASLERSRLFSPALPTAGRRQMILGNIALSAVEAVRGILYVGTVIVIFHVLAFVFPTVTFRGEEYTIRTLDVFFIWLTLLLLVWKNIQQLFPLASLVAHAMDFLVFVIVVYAWVPRRADGDSWFQWPNPIHFIIAIVTLWALYWALLRHVCLTNDLVGKKQEQFYS